MKSLLLVALLAVGCGAVLGPFPSEPPQPEPPDPWSGDSEAKLRPPGEAGAAAARAECQK